VTLKQATDLHTSSLSQSLAYHYLQTGRLPEQLKIIRASYKDKCQVLCEEIERELGEHLTFHRPQGGMFLWAKFKYREEHHRLAEKDAGKWRGLCAGRVLLCG
jgi:DNA-binding transcriptional MocR family regulator